MMTQNRQDIFPWQSAQWQKIQHLMHINKMPHTLLITGSTMLGQIEFAGYLSQTLTCAHPQDGPCYTCKSCQLHAAKTHPDILWIQPQTASQTIRVKAAREVIDFVTCTSNQGCCRVVIIAEADNMNTYAANALLKTLEEPLPNTFFILTQGNTSLLPTIRSRCYQIHFALPTTQVAQRWLAEHTHLSDKDMNLYLYLSHQNPLLAQKYAEHNELQKIQSLQEQFILLSETKISFYAATQQLNTLGVDFVLKWQLTFFYAMIKSKLTLQKDCQHTVWNASLCSILQQYSIIDLIHHYDWLATQQVQLRSSITMNPQLCLEALLARWELLLLSSRQPN
ncbi:MAG: hypothetical protein HAW62_03120 [Endozoicomonadaceae bacterium]|nr:hypothetical protein [Endozoicomonadaceae bacterium]